MRSTRVIAYLPLLLMAVLLLRAFVPRGYMPAAAGSGLLLELCPAASPVAAMTENGGTHEHHHSGQKSANSAESTDSDDHQCRFGHLLLFAMPTADHWQTDVQAAANVDALPPSPSTIGIVPTHQRNRGPPARKAIQYA